jgi:hypothetical protein
MSARLTPGSRWRSQVSTAEVIVVRAADATGELTCGDSPMVPAAEAPSEAPPPAGGITGKTVIGKRYTDADERIEVLCTKAGDGTLALDGVELSTKAAKALPASD